ncbi:MAG: YfhO family protein, partial [Ruminococcus sp.]|nr:YfhO family protein [Ruminococcus sp.]
VVETSIMEFYDKIGIQRDVASRADISHYTLRGLLSVKYFYREKVDGYTYRELLDMEVNGKSLESDEISDKNGVKASHVDISEYLPGFEFVAENEYFEIYENKYYIPMGFTYDMYISESEAEKHTESAREKPLIKALILDDEQIEKYSDILIKTDESIWNMNKSEYETVCLEKQSKSSDRFTWNSKGFESEITLDKPELVFFSVPYSEGWTAEVNGQPVDVEKVSYGFIAVQADEGENVITFHYSTPGFREGMYISITSLFILIIYLIICHFNDKKTKLNRFYHSYDYNSCHKITASELYTRNCYKNKED